MTSMHRLNKIIKGTKKQNMVRQRKLDAEALR